MLNRNLLIYGLGGVIAPFIGIKLIDLVVALIPGLCWQQPQPRWASTSSSLSRTSS